MAIDVTVSGLNTVVDVEFADSPSDIDPETYIALRGEKGDKGDTGAAGRDGTDGVDGVDGFSPIATVSKVGDTATISITDENGTTTATVTDGTDGVDGTDGQDGYTPIKGVDYFDGQDGADGTDGQDGFSPIANVSKVGDTATISITDANGTTTATISDGADGQNGQDGQDGQDGRDGYSPSATVTKSGTVATITITDKDGTTTAEVYDGSGSISDVKVDGTSVVTGGVAEIDLTGKSDVGHTHTKSAITDFPTLATVATSGDYDDLTDKPTIPSNVSDLTNDSGFLNASGILNLFYPIGSYYETSDASFDPNISWGGTWVLEAEGLVHIGAGSNYTLGDTGGEKTVTLTVAEMPSHLHGIRGEYGATASGAYPPGGQYYQLTGNVSYGFQTVSSESKGGDGAHNNMQPYIVVNRWHRTA